MLVITRGNTEFFYAIRRQKRWRAWSWKKQLKTLAFWSWCLLNAIKTIPYLTFEPEVYPLVNIQKTMENHHAINGTTHDFYGHFQ